MREYMTLDDLAQSSRKLIKLLEKGDVMDKVLIMLSLAVFILVVLYILKKRVLDKVRLFGSKGGAMLKLSREYLYYFSGHA